MARCCPVLHLCCCVVGMVGMVGMVLVVCPTGVHCQSVHPSVRLVGGLNPWIGYVQVTYRRTTGWLCQDPLPASSAAVICRQLGYRLGPDLGKLNLTSADLLPVLPSAHVGHQAIVQRLHCRGDEARWTTCSFQYGLRACPASVAMVACQNNVRLIEGQRASEGRVEAHSWNAWAVVRNSLTCSERHLANAACRDVGFHGAYSSSQDSRFGRVGWSTPVLQLCCGSTASPAQTSLNRCHPRESRRTVPGLQQGDAGVTCGLVRLQGGGYPWRGRVEVFNGEEWGTVCGRWTTSEAHIVCKHLGYSSAKDIGFGRYEKPGMAVHMSLATCGKGVTPTLLHCSYSTSGRECTNSSAVDVTCMRNCHYAATITNADPVRMPGQMVTSGNALDLVCRPGFEAVYPTESPQYVRCRDGTFYPALERISCRLIVCIPPIDPPNALGTTLMNDEGTQREYTCSAGYVMQGPSTLTCTSHRTWSARPPTCIAVATDARASVRVPAYTTTTTTTSSTTTTADTTAAASSNSNSANSRRNATVIATASGSRSNGTRSSTTTDNVTTITAIGNTNGSRGRATTSDPVTSTRTYYTSFMLSLATLLPLLIICIVIGIFLARKLYRTIINQVPTNIDSRYLTMAAGEAVLDEEKSMECSDCPVVMEAGMTNSLYSVPRFSQRNANRRSPAKGNSPSMRYLPRMKRLPKKQRGGAASDGGVGAAPTTHMYSSPRCSQRKKPSTHDPTKQDPEFDGHLQVPTSNSQQRGDQSGNGHTGCTTRINSTPDGAQNGTDVHRDPTGSTSGAQNAPSNLSTNTPYSDPVTPYSKGDSNDLQSAPRTAQRDTEIDHRDRSTKPGYEHMAGSVPLSKNPRRNALAPREPGSASEEAVPLSRNAQPVAAVTHRKDDREQTDVRSSPLAAQSNTHTDHGDRLAKPLSGYENMSPHGALSTNPRRNALTPGCQAVEAGSTTSICSAPSGLLFEGIYNMPQVPSQAALPPRSQRASPQPPRSQQASPQPPGQC